jgi:hypothetical protein
MAVTVLAFLISMAIFFSRDKGFEYVRYSEMAELYPPDPTPAFIDKWNHYNKRFTAADLKRGKDLLQRFAGLDTIPSAEARMIAIGSWIHRSFYRKVGGPSATLSGLSNPLQQYDLLIQDSSQKLWCSQYRSLFGFFCTAAGLQNRYIDAVPVDSIYDGFHGLNEVYLPELKKWAMADITRNILLLKKNDDPFSAADYYEFRRAAKTDTLTGIQGTDSLYRIFHSPVAPEPRDKYFHQGYMLRYYYTVNVPEVYTTGNKIRRYILARPWYQNYDPVRRHSNLLFRVKQFFVLLFILGLLGLIVLQIRAKSGEK